MNKIDRRTAATLGAFAFVGLTHKAYGVSAGKQVAPGVRLVDVSENSTILTTYPKVSIQDMIFEPGSNDGKPMPMPNDMVCHMLDGELTVSHDGKVSVFKKGDVWACAKSVTYEASKNLGTAVATMRIINLLPA